MKFKLQRKALKAVSLNVDELKQASGGRGTLCGAVLHCDGCGGHWGHDENGTYSQSCPTCGLDKDTDYSGGGDGGGGGGCY